MPSSSHFMPFTVELSTQTPQEGISPAALANGAVFTTQGTYWMLTPATAKSDPALLSYWENGQCSAISASFDVYQLAPNDPTVSGVPSAPVPGPVTIG